jgi:hypothetical protein
MDLPSQYNYSHGYITLQNLELAGLPDKINVAGQEFQLKDEFHLSLICVYEIANLIDPQRKQQIEKLIVREFANYIKNQPLDKFKLRGDYRFVQLDIRKTIIALADVEGLANFFKTLSQKFGKDLPVQPAHITLYTLQPNVGIGILSHQELGSNSAPISLPDLKLN